MIEMTCDMLNTVTDHTVTMYMYIRVSHTQGPVTGELIKSSGRDKESGC